MRMRLVAPIAIFFILVGFVVSIFLLGPGLPSNMGGSQAQTSAQQELPTSNKDNPIRRENANLGTTSWQIPPEKAATIEIQAYASATSVAAGQWLTFYVSTQHDGTPYFISIYRLGWYDGLGGRLMAPPTKQIGQAQGYYDPNVYAKIVKNRLINCTTCHVDTQTGLVEANWKPSYRLQIPASWTSGVYLAKFTDIMGKQTYVPFDVLGNFNSFAVAVTPDTSYQAFNIWGGYSLYANATGSNVLGEDASSAYINGVLARAVKVSFDRPYVQEAGSAQVLALEADAIRFLERKGYDVSYISNIDLHTNSAQLLHHSVYISLGQDEYWTKEMRDGVERARDSGVGLIFLGATPSYWQMRLEPDSKGVPNRTVVCYKVETLKSDLARDPLYGKDNSRVTALWRDPVIGRPENALVGIMFSDLTRLVAGYPWEVDAKVQSPLLKGTGLQRGQQYGCSLVGNEWDRVYHNGASPAGLTILGTSTTENNFGIPDVSNTTYYIAKSGAMVFATGSLNWVFALDDYRLHHNGACGNQDRAVPQLQQLLVNILGEMSKRHAAGQLTPVATAMTPSAILILLVLSASYLPSRLLLFTRRRRLLVVVKGALVRHAAG